MLFCRVMEFVTLGNKNRVYLDHNATTPMAQHLADSVPQWLQAWGNPSSIHSDGRGPKTLLRNARQNLAHHLGCHPMELVFTSGGSEANNMALKGVFEAFHKPSSDPKRKQRKQLIISAIEHPSIISSAEYLRSRGFKVDRVPVNRDGEFDLSLFKSLLSEETALVSVMFANNETGNIMPIKELVELTHQVGALFHSDCVQALGKAQIDLRELNVDLASFSGHKFYSLKGSGLLYIKKKTPIENLIHGGGQERGRRGGTENILSHIAFGEMAKSASLLQDKIEEMGKLRDYFESRVSREITDVQFTGRKSPRLPNSSSLTIAGIDGESLLMNLDIEGYSVSTGAACSSGNPEPSPVLLAMGLSSREAQSSLRIGIGWSTSQQQIDGFVDCLKVVVERLRRIQNEFNESHLVMPTSGHQEERHDSL